MWFDKIKIIFYILGIMANFTKLKTDLANLILEGNVLLENLNQR